MFGASSFLNFIVESLKCQGNEYIYVYTILEKLAYKTTKKENCKTMKEHCKNDNKFVQNV
jgi:hypothetical protein